MIPSKTDWHHGPVATEKSVESCARSAGPINCRGTGLLVCEIVYVQGSIQD